MRLEGISLERRGKSPQVCVIYVPGILVILSIRNVCTILNFTRANHLQKSSFGICEAKHLSRILNYEPIDQLPYLFTEQHVKLRHPSFHHLHSSTSCSDLRLFAFILPHLKDRICAAQTQHPCSCQYLGYPVVLKKKEIRLLHRFASFRSLESRSAAAHHFALAHQLCVEFGSIKCEVDVEIYTVKGSLGGIHSLEILLEILARKI